MWVPVSSAEEQSSREGVIDVLVPTRNRPTELATTLAGLAAQGHPFDVLVSDQSDGQASFDTPPATALLRVLAGHGRRIRTTRHLPRRGLAEHRAAMLAASSAPFALFCDDDVWLEPGVVGRLQPDERWLACKIAWVGGCVLYERAVLDAVGASTSGPTCLPRTAEKMCWCSTGCWRGLAWLASFRSERCIWSRPRPCRTAVRVPPVLARSSSRSVRWANQPFCTQPPRTRACAAR